MTELIAAIIRVFLRAFIRAAGGLVKSVTYESKVNESNTNLEFPEKLYTITNSRGRYINARTRPMKRSANSFFQFTISSSPPSASR